jgi:hypothetical protein
MVVVHVDKVHAKTDVSLGHSFNFISYENITIEPILDTGKEKTDNGRWQ